MDHGPKPSFQMENDLRDGAYERECGPRNELKVRIESEPRARRISLRLFVCDVKHRGSLLPGLPAPYDGTSIESIRLYLKSVSDFLSSPLVRLVCQSHPNHIALVSGPSASVPPCGTFSSWWSYFDTIGVRERHIQCVRSDPPVSSNDTSDGDGDQLKELVSSGTLPDYKLACNNAYYSLSFTWGACRL